MTNSPRIEGEVHPFELPKEIAENTATTAGKNRASPLQSKRTRAGGAGSGEPATIRRSCRASPTGH